MIGQIEPLEIGTEIIAYYDGDDKTISKYKITENISQGGSGIVYRAIRRRGVNEKEVILKEYYPSSNRNSMFIRHDGVIVKSTEPDIPYCSVLLKKAKLEKANSEGCSGGSSDHPGVVSCDICLINDILCATQIGTSSQDEWGEGSILGVFAEMNSYNKSYPYEKIYDLILNELYESEEGSDSHKALKELISQQRGSLSVFGIAILIDKIASSVGTVHEYDWVHRDIKLPNLLLDKKAGDSFLMGRAMLIDFGSAQQLIPGTVPLHAPIGDYPYTSGTTEGYRPPEIIDKNIKYEGWTKSGDLYQIGCIMYYLLSGCFPPKVILEYDPNNPDYLKQEIDKILEPNKLAPDAYDILKRILFRLLSNDPAERYEGEFSELRKDLKILERLTSSSRDKIAQAEENKNLLSKPISTKEYDKLFRLIDSLYEELSNYEWFNENTYEDLFDIKDIIIRTDKCFYSSHHIETIKLAKRYFSIIRNEIYNEKNSICINALVIIDFAYSVLDVIYNKRDIALDLLRESFLFLSPKNSVEIGNYKSTEGIEHCYYYYLIGGLRQTKSQSSFIEIEYLIDECEKRINNISLSDQIDFYILKCRILIDEKEYNEALNILDMLISKIEGSKSSIIEEIGLYFNRNNADYIKNALKDKISSFNYLKQMCTCISMKGDIYLSIQSYDEAINNFLEVIIYLDAIQDVYKSVDIKDIYWNHLTAGIQYDCLAASYYQRALEGDNKRAVDSILNSIEYFEKSPEKTKEYTKYFQNALDTAKNLLSVTDNEDFIKLYIAIERHKPNTVDKTAIKPIAKSSVMDSLMLTYNSSTIDKAYRPVPMKRLDSKTIDIILSTYGKGVDPDDIVAVLFSPKTFNRKKTGVLFTKQGICGSDFLTKRLIRYDELEIVGLANNGKVAFLFKNGQYDEFDFPAAKMLVKLLNGDKKIRDYK